MSSTNYTAIHGLMQLLGAQNNMPADGTGISVLVEQAHNLLGSKIPPVMVQYTLDRQVNLFGGYPDSSDIVPSAIFVAVYSIFAFAHLFVFIMNTVRGHYFFISLAWIFYCIVRVLGFGLRIAWAKDITNSSVGLGGEVLLVLASIILVSFNLILAQRIFTWRHPVGGSRMLFWNTMFALYAIVLGVIAMTIVSSALPSLYLLSEHAYSSCKKTVQASSILIDLYSLTSISLLSLAFFFKPTRKDDNLYTYQPWWIESFGVFYYVKSGDAKRAAETFMKRNTHHRHAKRVIAATHHHYKSVEGLSNQRGDLTHNFSMAILVISTVFIFVGALCRTVAVFQGRFNMDAGPVCKPIVMYICYGALEAIINILYLVGRVDLRFYRPDRLPKTVREIITAQQSVVVSEDEDYQDSDSEDEYIESDNHDISPEKRHSDADNDSEFRF